MLPLRARVELGAMAMKGYSAFPKAPAPSDFLVSYPGHSLGGGVLPLCREAVGVFYSPSRLGNQTTVIVLFVVEWGQVYVICFIV